MKTIRNSILGLATLYLVGNAIGCAPMQQKNPHAELDALLGEPVPEVMYLQTPESKPKAEVIAPSEFRPQVYSSKPVLTEIAREAETYMHKPAERATIALTPIPQPEETLEDIYTSCREGLKHRAPDGTRIRCEHLEGKKYASCQVSLKDDNYKVNVPIDDFIKGGSDKAYFVLLEKKPRLLDQLAKSNCSLVDFTYEADVM